MTAAAKWTTETVLLVDGVEFVARTAPRFRSTPARFCLVKRPALVRSYLDLLAGLRPEVIVELGICQGGSTALLALLARPTAMVAVDLDADRIDALDALLASRDLSEAVHLHYGVDQTDADKITAALHAAGVHGPVLDLVVDDA